MLIAKEFRFESAHRLPFHEGKCRHLHGHSYKMIVEFEGQTDANGMVVDFNEIKKSIQPYVEEFDHSTIISASDQELKKVFDEKGWRYSLMPFDSTAENLCSYFLNRILTEQKVFLQSNKITSVAVKIFETKTSYAYLSAKV